MDNNESTSVKNMVYLYSEPVQLVYYDKSSGEVSYTKDGGSSTYTCYDYELRCNNGIDGLRIILNSLPDEEYISRRRNENYLRNRLT